MSKTKDSNTKKHNIVWAYTVGDETQITATFDDIFTVVMIDLNNTYQTRGYDIFLQKHGCPIGGFLSAIYANTKCAHDEHNFFTKHQNVKHRIYGIRQMDDLILWIAFRRNDNRSKTKAEEIKNTILNATYTGGLQLEEQPYETLTNGTTIHKFAGTIITVKRNKGVTLICEPFLKNGLAISETGKQQFPCFMDNNSYTPKQYKFGIQITTYLRLESQSSDQSILLESMRKNALEMYSLGFDSNFLLSALFRLAKTSVLWIETAYLFATKLINENLMIGPRKPFIHKINALIYILNNHI
jgi:hypothetical protein